MQTLQSSLMIACTICCQPCSTEIYYRNFLHCILQCFVYFFVRTHLELKCVSTSRIHRFNFVNKKYSNGSESTRPEVKSAPESTRPWVNSARCIFRVFSYIFIVCYMFLRFAGFSRTQDIAFTQTCLH